MCLTNCTIYTPFTSPRTKYPMMHDGRRLIDFQLSYYFSRTIDDFITSAHAWRGRGRRMALRHVVPFQILACSNRVQDPKERCLSRHHLIDLWTLRCGIHCESPSGS